jgi:hypothetical protein
MKSLMFILLTCGLGTSLQAQSIIGNWQLIKDSNCQEETMTAANDSAQELVNDMKSMSSPSAQVVSFKEKQAGEESTRILNRKRGTNNKNFLYRFDGESLMILDKRSRTITENFIVDKFSTDSLVISNASRPCETKIFVRIK